jgi:hypothetical protein
LSPGLASKDGGGRGEGGNQLFRPRSRRGGEKVKGKNLRKVRSRVVEFKGPAAWVKLEALRFRRERAGRGFAMLW